VSDSNQRGKLLIISGPSGVGKSTVCQELTKRLDAVLSVSATTRSPRENEISGQDYIFMNRDQFEAEVERGALLEYAQVYGGHYYGTPAEPVESNLAAGKVVILEIEIDGTRQVVQRYPEAISIYLLAPSPSDQQSRLVGRQADSKEAIRERLSKADGEIKYAQESGVYRYFLINETIEGTVEAIIRTLQEN
jgi:guanylate kinase